jgi:hypothetical protein
MTLRIDMLSVHTSPLFNYYTYIKNVVDRVYLHCIDPQLDELRMNCREKDGKKRTESERGYRIFFFAVVSIASFTVFSNKRWTASNSELLPTQQ